MTFQIDETRLPLAVEAGARWAITTQTFKSGGWNSRETRQAKRRPRVEATIRVGPDDAAFVMELFRSQIGDRWAFTMRDWSDYLVGTSALAHHPPQILTADEDGNWPLTIEYGPGTRKATRRIILVDDDFELLIDDEVQSAGYSIVDGVVIFDSGEDPGSGPEVTWQGGFFFPGRFDEDRIEIDTVAAQNDGPPLRFVNMKVVELLEPL